MLGVNPGGKALHIDKQDKLEHICGHRQIDKQGEKYMRQHIEMVARVKKIKELQTRAGKWLYSFAVPISKMDGEEQLTEWLQVAILQNEQRKDLDGASEIHFIGELTVKAAYGDYPQGLSVFGFYIEPVLSQVYRHRRVKKNTPAYNGDDEASNDSMPS